MLSVRTLRLAAISLLLALVAAACAGSDSDDEGADAPVGTTTTVPLPTELVVGTPADTYNLEGDRANLGMFPINTNMFETLVRMTPDFQVEPWLAERWEYLGDNTWRLFLRDGVTFHNGDPFDAAAVKFSLDRLAAGGSGSMRIGPESTVVVDDLTVDITTTQPNLRLIDQLVHPSRAPMIAPGTDVGTMPTGTGPFRFSSYTEDERLVVERYDGYWGDAAKLERISFRFYPDDNTRWLALRNGEVDLIYDLPRTLIEEAGSTEGIKLGITPPGAGEIMFLNRSGNEGYTILTDADVRRAVAHAIDRSVIVNDIFPGAAEPYNTVSPAGLLGSFASLVEGVPYDPDAARELLDAAGWIEGDGGIRVKDGSPLKLTMINGYPPIDLRKPMPELIQSQLRAVGIDVEIVETPELATYSERLENGQGDLFLERIAQNDATPSQHASSFFFSEADNVYSDRFGANAAYDAAMSKALATPDREEAKELTAQALKIAVDEEVVVVPLAGAYWLFAMKDGVDGFVLHGSARHVRWAPVFWSAA